MSVILVYTTAPDEKAAKEISGALLEKRLIACANISQPHVSLYRWQGKIEEGREVAMILKTREELFDRVKEEILKLHSYECPCIVQIPVEGGHAAFLDWIKSETSI